LRDAALAWDTPRLASAITWVERFVAASDRTLFVPALGADAVSGRVWNRRTLDLLDRFIQTSPSMGRSRGEHVSTDVRRSYVGAIRLLRSRSAGYDVAPVDDDMLGGLTAKTAKRKEPATAQRALSLGLRVVHIAAAAAAGFDRSSVRGEMEWAAVVGGHNLLLRGGEVGEPDNAHPEPHRVLRGRSLGWQHAIRASGGRLWLVVYVVPIKDPQCNHRGFPTPVSRRHDGPLAADPLCPYDAFAALWWRRIGGGRPFPTDAQGRPADEWWLRGSVRSPMDHPLFVRGDGAAFRTSDARALFRRVAAAAGMSAEDVARVGAKALRIGGSTDARERLGEAAGHIIKRRGRWASDVAEVYQRELVGTQLRLSAELGDACGEGLEELALGWAQPG